MSQGLAETRWLADFLHFSDLDEHAGKAERRCQATLAKTWFVSTDLQASSAELLNNIDTRPLIRKSHNLQDDY